MKRSVFVGFVLLALIPLIYGDCWYQLPRYAATHCQDDLDKTWHPIGAEWLNSRCTRCTCALDGMRCCDKLPTSASGGCTIKYDYDACTFELKVLDENVPWFNMTSVHPLQL
ncbi:small serum protein 2-like isoform X3 [Hemibagrus wyckioides]|nr:small serum protein 2-like isoform X3 [Hemibagrus wyckioides]